MELVIKEKSGPSSKNELCNEMAKKIIGNTPLGRRKFGRPRYRWM
jgi:hypothetical protein